ncbi:uncharacterized protein LOC134677239 [Cydia fagiglandana]|uniref:uncharacterized protein LOC134677239 n=1 Tax=Cydia fagiglandana TaxID=1458189 RepID=UPI002FEE49B8
MATRPYQGYPYANPYVTDAPSIDAATASRWNNLPRRPLQPPLTRDEGSQVSCIMATRPYQGYPYVTDAPSVDAPTASRWNNLPRRPLQPPLTRDEGSQCIMATRPYQGYPYVTDAPSVDAPTASRWNNLPRRPLQPPLTRDEGSQCIMATRPYQGYPYVTDAPSVDAATASRWNNLPRRPLQPPLTRDEGSQCIMATRPYQGYPYVTDAPSVDAPTASRWNNLPRRPLQPPLTRDEGSQVSRVSGRKDPDAEPDPVIYIDVPESSGSDVAGPASSWNRKSESDSEPDPVIYIDVPDEEGSDVAGPARPEPEPEYVQATPGILNTVYYPIFNKSSLTQETIFYDPFENRRINRHKSSDTDTASGAGPSRPTPPNSLDLRGPSGSSGGASTFTPTPEFLSNPSSYGRDEFSLTPLPVGQYPDLPPAYSEFATPHTTQTPQTTQTPPESTPSPPEPPRTVVITPGLNYNRPPVESSIGLPSPVRKVVYCQHCFQRVHTLVIREIGPITHWIACFMFIFFFPFVVFVYCTKWFMYKNHYCPNCNKKIGYEMPAMCVGMTYIRPDTG